MDHQDCRKRAFSQAFQRLSQSRLLDSSFQPAKRMSSYPCGSTGLYQRDFGQKNALLPDQIRTPDVDSVPGTQVRHPQPSNVQCADSIHYSNASLRPKNVSQTILQKEHFKCPEQSEQYSTPMFVRGESMLGPRPSVRSSFNVLSNYSHSQESFMSDASRTINSPSPSNFGFDDLSLNTRSSPTPPAPPQCEDEDNRTTVRIVPTSSLECHFPQINPNEVTILFDRGREIRNIDKYPLCAASRSFAKILDGPFLDNGFTRCVRLREDFPYAVKIMLHFVETGAYVFDRRAFTAYPLLTTLDLHIHAYLVSTKYGITAMRDCVIEAYLETAEQEMTMGLMMLTGNQLSDLNMSWLGFPVVAPADERCDSETSITPMDRFLNSLVLLWKNTRSRHDDMRQVVLALIKRDLNKLLRIPLFVAMMQEVVGFGDDVVASLEGDGLGVRASQVAAGRKRAQSIFFGL